MITYQSNSSIGPNPSDNGNIGIVVTGSNEHHHISLSTTEDDSKNNEDSFYNTDYINLLNNSNSNDSYYDYENYPIDTLRHSALITGVYCFAYATVFVVGIIGNALVMMVVARTRVMKTTVFYFLFNLALADLLVLIFCLPATLLSNILNRK